MLIAKRCVGTCMYMGGIPAILEDFCHSWGQLIAFSTEEMKEGEYIYFDRTKASLHDVARNDMVNRMRGDWLLMLDTDHNCEPDLVLRMVDRLETAGIDVLTGIYQYKSPPHSPVIYRKADEFYQPIGAWRSVTGSDVDLFPVDACGAGCLLVRRTVFARIKNELGEEPFARIAPLGEDMSFARRCERLGIKIYCDARIEYHHLQTRPLSLEMYDREAIVLGKEFAVDAFVAR